MEQFEAILYHLCVERDISFHSVSQGPCWACDTNCDIWPRAEIHHRLQYQLMSP